MTDRLILWDIDGTLMSGGSVAREVFANAVQAVTGLPSDEHGVQMSGKTDPQIALEIMRSVGLPEPEARGHLSAVLAELERRLALEADRLRSEGRVHPGVVELLTAFDGEPGVVQSVLTGNIRANARLKLETFGLDRFLDLEIGAYGSDHEIRNELVAIALGRARELRGLELDLAHVWVFGDTPADLDCATFGGTRCVLVGTGRYGHADLVTLEADAVLHDLSDLPAVLRVVLAAA